MIWLYWFTATTAENLFKILNVYYKLCCQILCYKSFVCQLVIKPRNIWHICSVFLTVKVIAVYKNKSVVLMNVYPLSHSLFILLADHLAWNSTLAFYKHFSQSVGWHVMTVHRRSSRSGRPATAGPIIWWQRKLPCMYKNTANIRDVPIIGLAIISVANMLLFYYIGIATVCLESRYCYQYSACKNIFI